MVFIFAEVALVGKSFFHLAEGALVKRVSLRADRVQVGQETIGRDFFADIFAVVIPKESVAVFEEVADVFRQGDTGLQECFSEFDFSDVHIFIF